MLALVTPWEEPSYVGRAWCVYELLCAATTNTAIHIEVPLAERDSFMRGLFNNPRLIDNIMSRVSSTLRVLPRLVANLVLFKYGT